MSDHISGPRAIADPVSDITDTYAFPSPESPRNLVLIMNVFPFAGPSALFSDAVIHRYWVVAYRSVPDESARQEYSKLAAAAIQTAGGKGLVATTEVESREAGMNQRVVVIEFESLEKALAAYKSAAYKAARQALGSGAERDFRIVEGM